MPLVWVTKDNHYYAAADLPRWGYYYRNAAAGGADKCSRSL